MLIRPFALFAACIVLLVVLVTPARAQFHPAVPGTVIVYVPVFSPSGYPVYYPVVATPGYPAYMPYQIPRPFSVDRPYGPAPYQPSYPLYGPAPYRGSYPVYHRPATTAPGVPHRHTRVCR
jgi:hypothetical protein